MLHALRERRAERKAKVKKGDVLQDQKESYESFGWIKFWDEESPGLLLYACLHGTVKIVDYFVNRHVSPTTKYAVLFNLSLHLPFTSWNILTYM